MTFTVDKSVFCNRPVISGFTGTKTFTGPTGPTGPTGSIGFNGPISITGYTGSDGPTGLNGQYGSVGSNGVIGITGPTGSNSSPLIHKYIYTIGSTINDQIITYDNVYFILLPLNTTIIDVIICGGGGTSTYTIDGSIIKSSSGGCGNVMHLSRMRVNRNNQILSLLITPGNISNSGSLVTFEINSYINLTNPNINNYFINIFRSFGGDNSVINTVSANGIAGVVNGYQEYYESYIQSASIQTWNVGDDIHIIGAYPILDDEDVQSLSRGEIIDISGVNSDIITTTSKGNGGIILYCYSN
jgi:hypothetical protein